MASSQTAVTFQTAVLILTYSLSFKGGIPYAFFDLKASIDLSLVKANTIKFCNGFHQFFSTHRQD